MKVTITTVDAILRIVIEGSIDSKTAGDLQAQIMGEVSETNNVLLNLTHVEYVSSAGLRVLLMIYRQIKTKNGKVILVGVSEEIKDVMSMTGFINFFDITDDMDEALKIF